MRKHNFEKLKEFNTEGYEFEASKALVDENNFVGLGIDEDRQPELTEKRIKDWCALIYDEIMNIC